MTRGARSARKTTKTTSFPQANDTALSLTEDIRAYSLDGGTAALRLADRRLREDAPQNTVALLERSPALVLNSDYQPLSYAPLSVWSWQDAVKAIFIGKVTVVAEYSERVVRSANVVMRAPSVIALKGYQKRHVQQHPHFTRRNVFIRDLFRCQYCRGAFRVSELTYDHVVPRSKGGETNWTNVVTCCTHCNNKKGDLDLKTFHKRHTHLRLAKAPYVPSHAELASKARRLPLYRHFHPSWEAYVTDEY
eukprot:CAMPEP_0198649020 /NCGR_PEP_ID=MMETSP1467-20131203/3946_1 /TAXON_ID=1462469 /ORGANISM="unid. sp., Strain CCMP2135" /LENGTH=248 /DNA_ID=CAMNT_0044384771 /DNA_START=158 /DNA_END=904 /DNA_ORIENTATION=+